MLERYQPAGETPASPTEPMHRRLSVYSLLFAIFAVFLLSTARTSTTDTTFIEKGDVWKYLDNGSNQGTAWRASAFNDAAWVPGPAQLGYGDGDEATVVSFGPNSSAKYITTYFRRAFTVADPLLYQTLTLNILRDDGAVVYLNGTEVFRTNMPTGTIAYTTLANVTVGGADELAFVSASISPSLLVAGTNVLAVEIRQCFDEHGHQFRRRAHRLHEPSAHARTLSAAGHA
jgi:hypothetical protein